MYKTFAEFRNDKFKYLEDGDYVNDLELAWDETRKPIKFLTDSIQIQDAIIKMSAARVAELEKIIKELASSEILESVVRCKNCNGCGVISYNPNLNPNSFPGEITVKCTQCNGTGIEDN